MKRYGYLYEKIYDLENLKLAHKMARKGKLHYKDVQMVDSDVHTYLYKIQNMLQTQTYKTSMYTIFTIQDRHKKRQIAKLPYYPDRIVHWAIMLVIEPILVNNLIYDTYASIPARGTHKALHRIEHALRTHDLTHCLKLDIKKFFPSIDKTILKSLLRKKFKDNKLLSLLDEIIDSFSNGIPIGNYLSQYFANFYLSELDHIMKETFQCKHYYRYMDDIIILDSNKKYLHLLRRFISNYVSKHLNLQLKRNWQVFPIESRGIDFLGYVIRKNYTRLRKTTIKNIKRKVSAIQTNGVHRKHKNSLMSYFGWLKHADCKNFSKKYITNTVWRCDHEITVNGFTIYR
jgi:RNA-directed DNA polymerase